MIHPSHFKLKGISKNKIAVLKLFLSLIDKMDERECISWINMSKNWKDGQEEPQVHYRDSNGNFIIETIKVLTPEQKIEIGL